MLITTGGAWTRTTTLLGPVRFACPRCGHQPCNLYEISWTNGWPAWVPVLSSRRSSYALQCLQCQLERDLNAVDAARLKGLVVGGG